MDDTFKFHCRACSFLMVSQQLVSGCCPACQASLLVDEGLYDFRRRDIDYYYGEVPRDETTGINRVEREQGWREAVRVAQQRYGRSNPNLVNRMVDSRRAAWLYLARPTAFERALEIGCGWGGSVPALASQFEHVFGVDLTKEQVQFAQQRCLEMGLSNVAFGIGVDSLPLPFASESFDLIAMSGVLAYVAETVPGDPRTVQLEFLREVSRMMKPEGVLYIGGENRFGWPYLWGKRDHCHLRWTSLMPRWMANAYSRGRTGGGYRTPTYSSGGYGRLLKEAGFPKVEFYWPHQDHSDFRFIAPLDRGGIRRVLANVHGQGAGIVLKSWLARRATSVGLFRYLVPSFSIVSRK